MNILRLMVNLAKMENWKIQELYKGGNRINNIGDGLEEYLKDAFANTFDSDPKVQLQEHNKIFSYQGSSARPPDLMLRSGAAIEVKKVESLESELQLNSSHPKDFLKADSPFIKKTCRECEDWQVKDIIYIVGHIPKSSKTLSSLWCVYGSIYAASEEVYLNLKQQIETTLNAHPDLQFSETKELGRLNQVDPLKITNMRVRGMWLIQPPKKAFSYIYQYQPNKTFQVFMLIPLDKYNAFDEDSKKQIDSLVVEKVVNKETVEVKDPNNPVALIKSILLTLVIN